MKHKILMAIMAATIGLVTASCRSQSNLGSETQNSTFNNGGFLRSRLIVSISKIIPTRAINATIIDPGPSGDQHDIVETLPCHSSTATDVEKTICSGDKYALEIEHVINGLMTGMLTDKKSRHRFEYACVAPKKTLAGTDQAILHECHQILPTRPVQ